jgi:hypothetical protein
MIFNDTFLDALGSWQRGWLEKQHKRVELAETLKTEALKLPKEYRSVRGPCFRKRFLLRADLVPLLVGGRLHDGMTSWTLNPAFADTFKGLGADRPEAVTAAIFRHEPAPSEVILNIPALWASGEFNNAVMGYEARGGQQAEPLLRIRDIQAEVILETNLLREEVVAFSGKSSPFEELCKAANISEKDEDAAWQLLIDLKKQPEMPTYIRDDTAQVAILNTLLKLLDRLQSSGA